MLEHKGLISVYINMHETKSTELSPTLVAAVCEKTQRLDKTVLTEEDRRHDWCL